MPPAPKNISREYRIYLAIWRKAYLQPDGAPHISITCPNFHMAVSMRQGMYRAIRPFREGATIDEELRQSAEKFVVYLVRNEDKSKSHFLELRERKALAALELELQSLGIDEEDLKFGEERTLDQKLTELIERPEEGPRATPFYEREA